MKHLKTIAALLLILTLALALAACGGEKPDAGKSEKDDGESSEKDEREDEEDEEDGLAYALYIKDGEMYYSDLTKGGAWQVTSRLWDGAGDSDLGYKSHSIANATVISRDGETLFFPDKMSAVNIGITLYYRSTDGKGDAAKIDSDVNRYCVNDKASLVTYHKNGNLYQYDMRRDEKEKLASGVAFYNFFVSDNGKKIIYLDNEDTLYQLDSGKDREKLDGGVDFILAVSDDCKAVVYQKGDTLYFRRDGRDKVRIVSGADDILFVYDTGEVYYTMEDHGDLTLCYFDGEGSAELTDNFSGGRDDWYDTSYFPAHDIPMLVYRDNDGSYWLAVGGAVTELDVRELYDFIGYIGFSLDGKSVWYVDAPDEYEEGELYQIPISGGRAKKARKVDDEVFAVNLKSTSGEHLYYYKSGDGAMDLALYVDGEKVDDDILQYSEQWSDSGALMYYADSDSVYSTLKQYSKGKTVKIAEEVLDAAYLPNGSILYLAGYDDDGYCGDLYVYSGGKSTKLDEDVLALALPYSDKYGHYF